LILLLHLVLSSGSPPTRSRASSWRPAAPSPRWRRRRRRWPRASGKAWSWRTGSLNPSIGWA